MKKIILALALTASPAIAFDDPNEIYRSMEELRNVQPPQASGYRVIIPETPIPTPTIPVTKLERFGTTDGETIWMYHTTEQPIGPR